MMDKYSFSFPPGARREVQEKITRDIDQYPTNDAIEYHGVRMLYEVTHQIYCEKI